MSDHKDVIIGTTVGVAVGVLTGIIFGLLYAPKPGKELRQDIRDKAQSIAADIRARTGHATLKDIKS
jgi:gas vesicle protein